MAEAWSIPPWLIEQQAPAVWVDRFLLLANARAEKTETDLERVRQATGTGKTSQRVD